MTCPMVLQDLQILGDLCVPVPFLPTRLGDSRCPGDLEETRSQGQLPPFQREDLLAREIRDDARNRLPASADATGQILLGWRTWDDGALGGGLALVTRQVAQQPVEATLD